MLFEQAKNVEDLDGKRFEKEHSPGGARINAAARTPGKNVCCNVMNKGHCGRQNFPYSHDRNAIMSAALKRIRSQHANSGAGAGAGAAGGANQGNGAGRGRGKNRGNRGGCGRNSSSHNRGGGKVKTELCKKEGPCPLPGHGDHAQFECPHLNAIREQALADAIAHFGKVFVGNTTATQTATVKAALGAPSAAASPSTKSASKPVEIQN